MYSICLGPPQRNGVLLFLLAKSEDSGRRVKCKPDVVCALTQGLETCKGPTVRKIDDDR